MPTATSDAVAPATPRSGPTRRRGHSHRPASALEATVVGYLRVSTADQADSGAGLAAQRASIAGEGARRGWQLTWAEDAGASGATLNRAGLRHALRLLASGDAQVLVVAKLDRISRSVQDFAALLETARRQGWALVALDLGVDTTTPAGELVANVMAAVAQWERRVIGARTAEALAAKRAQGVRLGRPVATSVATRARIGELARQGLSHAAIARHLNDEGVTTAQGKAWHRSGVRRTVASLACDAVAEAAAS